MDTQTHTCTRRHAHTHSQTHSVTHVDTQTRAQQLHGDDVHARLIFSDRIDWRTHLLVKSMANLSLDNPVFNSHTSGVDILWSGVPLLTLPR